MSIVDLFDHVYDVWKIVRKQFGPEDLLLAKKIEQEKNKRSKVKTNFSKFLDNLCGLTR